MIRQWQEIVYGGNYHSEQLAGPDYLKLCEAYGLPAWKVSKPEEVDAAVTAALAADGPALIWFAIAERQNVYPMMPAGKGLSDLIDKWGDGGEAVDVEETVAVRACGHAVDLAAEVCRGIAVRLGRGPRARVDDITDIGYDAGNYSLECNHLPFIDISLNK